MTLLSLAKRLECEVKKTSTMVFEARIMLVKVSLLRDRLDLPWQVYDQMYNPQCFVQSFEPMISLRSQLLSSM